MDRLNAILTRLADWLLAPLSGHPTAALIVAAVVCGAFMTIVFKHTSNQAALKRAAGRTRALLMSMRLFKDDLRVALKAQWELLVSIGRRLALSIPPLLVLCVPFVLILAQLALRYEHRPLTASDAAIVELRVRAEQWEAWRNAELIAPPGVRIETPPLRDAARHTVCWRVRADEPAHEPLRFAAGDDQIGKSLTAARDAEALATVSGLKPSTSIVERLLFPGEDACDGDSAVRNVKVQYPPRATPIFGVNIPWWGTFLIVSMLTALLLKPFVKVQF
jgi:hypothetical protein